MQRHYQIDDKSMGPLHYTDQHLESQKDSGAKTKLHACTILPLPPTLTPQPFLPTSKPASLPLSPLHFEPSFCTGIFSQTAMCIHIFREHSFSLLKDQFGLSVAGLAGEEMVRVSFPPSRPPRVCVM